MDQAVNDAVTSKLDLKKPTPKNANIKITDQNAGPDLTKRKSLEANVNFKNGSKRMSLSKLNRHTNESKMYTQQNDVNSQTHNGILLRDNSYNENLSPKSINLDSSRKGQTPVSDPNTKRLLFNSSNSDLEQLLSDFLTTENRGSYFSEKWTDEPINKVVKLCEQEIDNLLEVLSLIAEFSQYAQKAIYQRRIVTNNNNKEFVLHNEGLQKNDDKFGTYENAYPETSYTLPPLATKNQFVQMRTHNRVHVLEKKWGNMDNNNLEDRQTPRAYDPNMYKYFDKSGGGYINKFPGLKGNKKIIDPNKMITLKSGRKLSKPFHMTYVKQRETGEKNNNQYYEDYVKDIIHDQSQSPGEKDKRRYNRQGSHSHNKINDQKNSPVANKSFRSRRRIDSTEHYLSKPIQDQIDTAESIRNTQENDRVNSINSFRSRGVVKGRTLIDMTRMNNKKSKYYADSDNENNEDPYGSAYNSAYKSNYNDTMNSDLYEGTSDPENRLKPKGKKTPNQKGFVDKEGNQVANIEIKAKITRKELKNMVKMLHAVAGIKDIELYEKKISNGSTQGNLHNITNDFEKNNAMMVMGQQTKIIGSKIQLLYPNKEYGQTEESRRRMHITSKIEKGCKISAAYKRSAKLNEKRGLIDGDIELMNNIRRLS